MKIKSIKYTNVDKLYYAICLGFKVRDPKVHGTLIGDNYPQLLRHVTVILDVDEVSILEAYCLKMLSNDHIYPMETYYTTDSGYLAGNKVPVREACEKLSTILDEMRENTDIRQKPDGMFMPVGMVRKHLYVTLTGHALLSIFTGIPEKVMFDNLGIKWDPSVSAENAVFPNGTVQEKLKEFIEHQVEYTMHNLMKSLFIIKDTVTPVVMLRKYYQYAEVSKEEFLPPRVLYIPDINEPVEVTTRKLDLAKKNFVTLVDVYTLVGSLQFLGEDAKELEVRLKQCIEGLKNGVDRDTFLESTRFHFVLSTPLYLFLELSLALPIHMIVSHEEFQSVAELQTGIFIQTGLEGYENRLGNWINDYLGPIIWELTDIAEVPSYADYIPLNTKIAYTMEITLAEVEKYIFPLSESVLKGSYGDFYNAPSVLTMLLHEILEEISQYANQISQVLYPTT